MQITLKAGEKLYLNGAVLRADRKVSLELMNDAVFLLEAHVMSVEKATTPIRQLYFVVQTMLMSPNSLSAAETMFDDSLTRMKGAYSDPFMLNRLNETAALVRAKRYFDALKLLRGAFQRDDALMSGDSMTDETKTGISKTGILKTDIAKTATPMALAS